jgi:hypothetical protein
MDEVEYVEIAMAGRKNGADDNRKYFIRMTLKNNRPCVEFGHTWSYNKIKEKYQICLAMIKGIVLPYIPKNLVKDESKYDEYTY